MSSTLNHRARHNPYLPCLHCYRTLICMFVFSSELKFNSSWKWQPSWSLKLAYLSQLARSRTACVAGPCWHTILANPLASSTPIPWLPRHRAHLVGFFLLLFYSVHADCLQSSHVPQNRYSSGIAPGSLQAPVFLLSWRGKRSLSSQAGACICHPEASEGPARTAFHSCSSYLQGPVGAQQHQRSQRDGNSKSKALKTTLTLEPEVTKEESLNRVTAC